LTQESALDHCLSRLGVHLELPNEVNFFAELLPGSLKQLNAIETASTESKVVACLSLRANKPT
jgi:hypothetical protein